jgi:alpha-galactosidase
MTTIRIEESGLQVLLEVTTAGEVRLLHFSSLDYEEAALKGAAQKSKFPLVEVQLTGENHDGHHGAKHIETLPGKRLIYTGHRIIDNDCGPKLEIELSDLETGLRLAAHWQFYRGFPVARCYNVVENTGDKELELEYVSSFALTGLAKEGKASWGEKMKLHLPHNSWYGELQWHAYKLPELGLSPVNRFTTKRVTVSNTGSWSSGEYVPMGCLENTETGSCLFWQIEHHGSWHYEIGDHFHRELNDAGTDEGHLYIRIGGPTERENHWWKKLRQGETFVTVPVAVGAVNGGLEAAARILTGYRRCIRRSHRDNQELPVIFNDFMNCLFGDPTAEKLYPLIDSAAEAGCEIFCIDAGWYADGEWWDEVGEWQPSVKRFPEGLGKVTEYIRTKGMVPGLWLEIEVMGVHCPLAERVPDEWFFCRRGKRVIDNGRYQLDFRHEEVRRFADGIIDRLVREYGAGYIKMDYNINIGAGTDLDADSAGDGMLQHQRAYVLWLDSVFARYPDLIIEHCSSGGMRMDYSLLSRHSVASISDQTDYRKMALIAAAAPTAVTPEQAAVWSYPLETGGTEEVAFNMVNAMLLRIHQSGHLARMTPERMELVREAIAYYKSIRRRLAASLPFWPLGLPKFGNAWTAMGLEEGDAIWLAVWRLDGTENEAVLALDRLANRGLSVRCAYPAAARGEWFWDEAVGRLHVRLAQPFTARLFEFMPLEG